MKCQRCKEIGFETAQCKANIHGHKEKEVKNYAKMQSKNIVLDPIPTDLDLAVRQIKKIHEVNCLKNRISINL